MNIEDKLGMLSFGTQHLFYSYKKLLRCFYLLQALSEEPILLRLYEHLAGGVDDPAQGGDLGGSVRGA